MKILLFFILTLSVPASYSITGVSAADSERQEADRKISQELKMERERREKCIADSFKEEMMLAQLEVTRRMFEAKADKLTKPPKHVLVNLYKKINNQVTDQFAEKEVDNYLSTCGCCYPGPSKNCTIL